MKKIIYSLIKYPLILIFIKTPFINILKKRFKHHLSLKNRSIIWFTLDTLFQREYFNKLKNKLEIRELTSSTLTDGEGRKWAQHYYDNHFKTLSKLRKNRIGTMSASEAQPTFENMINFIKLNNLTDDENTYIIQLGSSSGRDLEFFLRIFPKLNYISTDINDEILNFQKEKYNYSNLKYFKCYAEDIDECINYFDISNKNIILFSIGSLQYVNPFFLEEFFLKIKKYQKFSLFVGEPVNLLFIDSEKKTISKHRGKNSFSHRYDEYAKEAGFNIIENKVIRAYSKDDKHQSSHTGHFDLQISN